MTSMKVADKDYENSINVTVEWRNITLNAQTAAGPKAILKGLTGHASPGELVAIMGPSGAGKTTLLNCLAQRTPGALGGEVLLNGVAWREQFFAILAYMPQDEVFLAELTPREHLGFMAQLRLHKSASDFQSARVEQVISEMKLQGVANQLIGNPELDGGLSRNERKRLNFATETLTEPLLLYVDEPTTGLDSVMAASVVRQLKLMARGTPEAPRKRTVLATIHQPSSEIYALFDKLYFIVDGRAAYFGGTSEVPSYFGKLGHPMPEHTNPSDFTMSLFVDPADREAAAGRRKDLCDGFSTAEKPAAMSQASNAALAQVEAVEPPPLAKQFQVLMRREAATRGRMPVLTKAIVLRNAVLGLILGALLLDLDMSQTYVYSITGAIFFGVSSMVMPTAIGHISTLPSQLVCVVREVRSNAYAALPFFLTKFVSDLPLALLGSLIFTVLLNYMTGMADYSLEVWLDFLAIFFAGALLGDAIGQWGAILAPPSMPFIGLVAMLVVIIPQFLFCGVLILLDKIPPWWAWAAEVSVFRYFLELSLAAQWKNYGEIPCDFLAGPGGKQIKICPFPNGEAVLTFYGMGRPGWVCWLVIAAWWALFKVSGFRILLNRCRPPTSAFGGGPPPDDATEEAMGPRGGGNTLLGHPDTDSATKAAKAGGDLEEAGGNRDVKKRRTLVPMELTWRDLGLTVQVKGKGAPVVGGAAADSSRQLLGGLSGLASPGELVAIMGASGSGKSVLLKTLGRRMPLEGGLRESGAVSFNGAPLDVAEHSRRVAFLDQEDQFIAEVTVEEHLLFHASLRMDRDISVEARRERVEEILEALGLAKARATFIGAIGSGISGGERRRLSYGAELLQDSSLLFLDEPTSGLDSSMAEMVVQTLKVVANQGATVLCTIHQPSAKVFKLFDKLLLLAGGEACYFGPAQEALAYFESLGFPCPATSDAVEHMMTTVDSTPVLDPLTGAVTCTTNGRDAAVSEAKKRAASQGVAPKKSAKTAAGSAGAASAGEGSGAVSQYDSSAYEQLRSLMAREWAVRKRSVVLTKAVLGRTVAISILVATIYMQVDKDQQGVFSITGALSFLVINHVFTYAIGQAVNMPLVVPSLGREHGSNMYSVHVWYLAKTLADLPFDMATTLVLATVVYWSVGFTDDFANFVYFVMMLVLVALLSTGFGYFVGTIAAVLNKPEMSVLIVMLILFPMFLFAGLLVNFNNVPDYLLWLQYLSIFYYSFSLVSVNQWADYGAIECSAKEAAATGLGRCAFMTGEDVLAYFGVDETDAPRNLAIVAAMIVFFRVGSSALLTWKLKQG